MKIYVDGHVHTCHALNAVAAQPRSMNEVSEMRGETQMYSSEMIKENWTTLQPKLRVVWPNLTEQDVQAINGDGELLVTKVREKYGFNRDGIFSKLAPYLPVQPAKAIR